MAEKIKVNDKATQAALKELVGQIVTVNATLTFTKNMTVLLQGDDLEKNIQNQITKMHRDNPIKSERYTFNCKDASVVKAGDTPTIAERIVRQSIYGDDKYLEVNKSRNPFDFGYKMEKGIMPIDLAGKSVLKDQRVQILYEVYEYAQNKEARAAGRFKYTVGPIAVVFEEYPKLWVAQSPEERQMAAARARGWLAVEPEKVEGSTVEEAEAAATDDGFDEDLAADGFEPAGADNAFDDANAWD